MTLKRSLILVFLIASVFQGKSQVKFYATGGPEIIFSLAEIDDNGQTGGNILRFAPWFNLQVNANLDMGKNFGLFTGGAIRNVGFIYEYSEPGDGVSTTIKKKYRNYDFGLPIGFKAGKMNSWLVYGGYEIEFPFAYKEKTFVNNKKTDEKITGWFTGRVPAYYNSFFFGIQFPYGFGLKFKYYTSQFFNQNYTAGDGSKPYAGLKANVWYISLNFSVFRNNRLVYQDYADEVQRKNANRVY